MKRILIFSLILFSLCSESLATPYYIESATPGRSPWGRTNYSEDMNAVFGVGGWINEKYETINADDLFSSANDFIYLEGSDRHAQEMEDFITAHKVKMEAWVYAGGTLFLNAAPNEGDGMDFGFGVSLVYSDSSRTVTAVDPDHGIFHEPFGVTGTTFSGNSFAHSTVNGSGLNPLLQGTSGRYVLAEKTHGRGVAFFGGMTSRYYHSPQPQVSYLHQNILKYQASAVGVSLSYNRNINMKPGQETQVEIQINNRDEFPIDVNINYPFSTLAVTGPANVTVDTLQSVSIMVNISSEYQDTGSHEVLIELDVEHGEQFVAKVKVNLIDFEQITKSDAFNSNQPSLSSDGNLIAFVSNADLASTNKPSSSKDIFIYDVKQDVLSQLTNNPSGRSCVQPEISGNGLFLAALCNSSLDNRKSNADANYELVYFDLSTDEITQVNNDSRTYSYNYPGLVAINHDGSQVYFISNSNLDVAEGNSDGSAEVFVYERNGDASVRQISQFNYSNYVQDLSTDYTGQRFVVSARGNPLGENSRRYFRVFSGNPVKGVTNQLTPNTYRHSSGSAMSGNGKYVVFSSNDNLDPSSNANSRYQIYRGDFEGTEFEQITPISSYDSYAPSISNDGSKVVFHSKGSFYSTNYAANDELYLKDFRLEGNKSLKLITEVNDSRGAKLSKISADASAIVFSGNADWLLGDNSFYRDQVFYQGNLSRRSVSQWRESEERIYSTSSTFIVVASEDDDDEEDGLGSTHPVFLLLMGLLFYRRITHK